MQTEKTFRMNPSRLNVPRVLLPIRYILTEADDRMYRVQGLGFKKIEVACSAAVHSRKQLQWLENQEQLNNIIEVKMKPKSNQSLHAASAQSKGIHRRYIHVLQALGLHASCSIATGNHPRLL